MYARQDSTGDCRIPLPAKVALFFLAVAGLAGLNFVVGLGVQEFLLGGTAQLGYIEDGQHFLGSHGRFTPVSPETFWTCFWYWRISLFFAAAAIALAALSAIWARAVSRTAGEDKPFGTSSLDSPVR